MTSTQSSGSIDTLLAQAAPRQDAGEVLVRDYVEFVSRTDLSKGKQGERFDIAVYGLVGEIGSLVAAIKKRLLAAGRRNWGVPNPEIIEELGDSLWYCFAVSAASGLGGTFLAQDIEALLNEVGGEGGRSERIRSVLGKRADAFLKAGPGFLAAWNDGSATLDDYRRVAFLTSRTQDDQLVEVSLAVLQQLTAELLRRNLPEIEKDLNRNLKDRSIEVVLGRRSGIWRRWQASTGSNSVGSRSPIWRSSSVGSEEASRHRCTTIRIRSKSNSRGASTWPSCLSDPHVRACTGMGGGSATT